MQNEYRAQRKKAGLSSTQAAAKLDVSITTLMSWEQGKTAPKGNQLVEMVKLYGCTADELLGLA